MNPEDLRELERLLLIRASHRCTHCANGSVPEQDPGGDWEHQHGPRAIVRPLACEAGTEWEVLYEVQMELGSA